MKGQRFGAFFCDQKLELKQMCSSTLEVMINKRAPARLRSPISLTSFFLRQRQQTELLLKELATCTWGRVHISALCHTGDWHDNFADSVKHTGYWEFWPVWQRANTWLGIWLTSPSFKAVVFSEESRIMSDVLRERKNEKGWKRLKKWIRERRIPGEWRLFKQTRPNCDSFVFSPQTPTKEG